MEESISEVSSFGSIISSSLLPVKEEHHVPSISGDYETTCWGCGLHRLLPSYSPIFKCGWCGALTDRKKTLSSESVCFSRWRRVRDRSLVTGLLLFMLFVICAGVWAIYPVAFSISYFYGIVQCMLTSILSIVTISSFFLAAFRPAGAPANILWGSYPTVGKGDLENFMFCVFCAKPKPPKAHHCRSCRMCVMDMDHHCPFIGNCVGAGNHQYFVAFLISVVISCLYVFLITSYAAFRVWPPLKHGNFASAGLSTVSAVMVVKEIVAALASSALHLSARGMVLIYLAFASLSVEIGISVLLWQQLYYIYEGRTYMEQISSKNITHGEMGCKNLLHFFGCPYSVFRGLLGPGSAGKTQGTLSSKLL